MRLTNVALTTLLLVTGMALSGPARAGWPSSPQINVPICTSAASQTNPVIISDGAGGAIIAWEDSLHGRADIYVQRVSVAGLPLWSPNGVALCSAMGDQTVPVIVSDGSGGAIVAWQDTRALYLGFKSTSIDIYAQRVSSTGVPLWTTDGVALCTAPNEQYLPAIASDTAGGAIVTWYDGRTFAGNDIYAQRVNASGTPLWTKNGVALCTATNYQETPTIVPDGTGGAIVAWHDSRNMNVTNWDIYAQKIDASGITQWAPNGTLLSAGANTDAWPKLISDGSGGAIVTWYDNRSSGYSGHYDIYAQRVGASGTNLWATNGVALCTAVNDQRTPTIVTDGAGGAIVCWYDLRNNRADVYAQHVNPAGVPQWTADGLAVCTVGDPQYSRWIDVRRGPACIADGAGGVIVTWVDQRNGGTGTDVYAQRVSHSGVSLWATNGSALCSAPGDQFYPEIVGDPTGGAIATWFDSRSGVGYDIYAQRIQASGALGSDETVPAASALVRSHREHGLLQVTWYTTGNAGTAATVFRRPNTSEWSSIGEIQADGAGYMTFVDRDIEDDAGYSYRLGIVGPDGVQMLLGEAWIAPLPSSFAMAPAVSTPFRNGRISMAVSTPVSFPATVQLFDVAGRKLEQSIVESAARSRQVDFGAGRRLEPGIYHVRAHCGGDALTMRVVVIP